MERPSLKQRQGTIQALDKRTPFFTTSWDDGSEYDLRVADLLIKHGIKGTFYIPIENIERKSDSLSKYKINEIGQNFEIGGHTYSHVPLTSLNARRAKQEIFDSKTALEDILGRGIKSFCFPHGCFVGDHIKMVRDAGFLFARTTGFLRIYSIKDMQNNLLHTTLHAYPHKYHTYFLSAFKRRDFEGLKIIFSNMKLIANLNRFSSALLNEIGWRGGVFHLWGHSWEIEKYRLWGMLELLFEVVKEIEGLTFCTNVELWRRYECL